MATSKVRATPAFEGQQLRQGACIHAGDVGDVMRAHAGGEQRLVPVAHGGVGEEHTVLLAHPFREAFGPRAP